MKRYSSWIIVGTICVLGVLILVQMWLGTGKEKNLDKKNSSPEQEQAESIEPTKEPPKYTVVLDAGHGGS